MFPTTARKTALGMQIHAENGAISCIDEKDYFIWTDGRNWKTAAGLSDPRVSSKRTAIRILIERASEDSHGFFRSLVGREFAQ